MGLFDKYFAKKNISNYYLSRDQILHLITITNQMFDKERIKFEREIFGYLIINGDIPIEYQEVEVALEQEFRNRYTVSSGIISIAIMEYLIKKHMDNSHNNNLMNSVEQFIFPNVLKIRKKILSVPITEDFHFDDTENEILNTPENFILFSERISLISNDIKSFIDTGEKLNCVRNYFGVRIGQVLPEILEERDKELGDLIKNTLRKILQNFEMYFIDLL